MTANEYYRRFIDLSRYDPKVADNPVEMLRRFRLGTRKKWRSMATTTPCAAYQEIYEILLRIEDLENMPSESDEEENDGNQKKDDKGKGQSSQGPRKTQSFKRSGASSSSSSGGMSSTGQGRGGVTVDILGSAGRVVDDVLSVVNLGIGLCIVLRISKGPSSHPYHP
ncbi:hypothetical protein TB2_006839 [Malus domestica]